jgi:ABC-type branched-subunit amino acid transport system ATPase component
MTTASPGTGLVVDELEIRFGGLVAVRDLSLTAPPGRITGLIGPNGAGKSTTFNACSGFVTPAAGRIAFNDVDLTHAPATRRAKAGIGRTFQRMQLFDHLPVRTNVALGRELGVAGRSPVSQLWARSSERSAIAAAADEALALCGIEHLADERAGALSTGERRLVELARALAGDFSVLLLDEPSSGLDVTESQAFGELLDRIVKTRGTGILIVEHDMSLIASICQWIYVLDFGRLIFEGPPDAVLASETVRAAYLGTEPIPEAARS